MKSFANIYDRIKAIATNHRQINTFGHGQEWDRATSGTTNYPMFWAVPRGSKIRKGEIGYDFDFIVQDLIQKDYANLEDGLSDTHQTLTDVLSELKWGDYAGIDLKVSDFAAEPFIEGTDDECLGWTCRVTIWTDFNWNSCTIPTIT